MKKIEVIESSYKEEYVIKDFNEMIHLKECDRTETKDFLGPIDTFLKDNSFLITFNSLGKALKQHEKPDYIHNDLLKNYGMTPNEASHYVTILYTSTAANLEERKIIPLNDETDKILNDNHYILDESYTKAIIQITNANNMKERYYVIAGNKKAKDYKEEIIKYINKQMEEGNYEI